MFEFTAILTKPLWHRDFIQARKLHATFVKIKVVNRDYVKFTVNLNVLFCSMSVTQLVNQFKQKLIS